MRFEELKIRGFMSFGPDEQTVKLGKRGLVLIEGENRDDSTVANNGSGKSSISEALLWALFGKTFRGKSGDGVVNRKVKNGCRVEVTFSNDAGEKFRVIRYRKDPSEKNKLEFLGPRALTASETSETEKAIVDALGMDFDTFTSAVIFGQGQIEHFASMTDKEMKVVIDKLIGIQQLVSAHKAARADFLVATQELRDIEAKKVDTATIEADLADAEKLSAGWAGEQKKRAAELSASIKRVNVSADTAELKEAKALRDQAVANQEKKAEAFAKADADVASCLSTGAGFERSLARLSKDESGTCAVCGGTIDGKTLAAHRNELQNLLDEANKQIKAASLRRDTARTDLRESKDVVKLADAAIKEIDDRLTKAKLANVKADEVERQLQEMKSATNPHEKTVAKLKQRLEKAEESNADLAKQAKTKSAEVKRLEFVVAMFSDKGQPGLPPLKGLLVESVAPFLNKKLAYYARFLTDGVISVKFNTTSELKNGEKREEYAIEVTNRFGDNDYAGASGGERRKIDAVIFFAFQALAASRSAEQVRFAVWDEVFDALDEVAQEVMMELLLEEKARKDTMLVITQRPELRAYFPRSIKVVKERGFSTLAK